MLSRCLEGRTLGRHNALVSSIDWSPNGLYLATTSYDGTAIVWSVATGRPGPPFGGHHKPVFAACFSPDVTGFPDMRVETLPERRPALASASKSSRIFE